MSHASLVEMSRTLAASSPTVGSRRPIAAHQDHRDHERRGDRILIDDADRDPVDHREDGHQQHGHDQVSGRQG
jgi:hypothetical protein